MSAERPGPVALSKVAAAVRAAVDDRRRDPDRAAGRRLARTIDDYRRRRGLEPGDRVDVVGGVPGTLGAPVAEVVRTAAKSVVVRVYGEDKTRRIAPDDVRLCGADVVREAERLNTRTETSRTTGGDH